MNSSLEANGGPLHASNGRLPSGDPWAAIHGIDSPGLLPEEHLPSLYKQAYHAAASEDGTVTPKTLARTLRGANLQPQDVDKIMNLTAAGRTRLSLGEFSVALALAAFAQQKQEISIEHVVSSKDSLPTPRLASTAALSTSRPSKPRGLSEDAQDPWGSPYTQRRHSSSSNGGDGAVTRSHYPGSDWAVDNDTDGFGSPETGSSAFRTISTAQLERQWETVQVRLAELAGRYLNKYTVYEITNGTHDTTVARRYSDFAWLHSCLERRYPFRLLPTLPPKRLAINGAHAFADDGFLERRRRGLQRYITWIANHHILKNDGLVHTFFAEPDLTLWRKSTPVSLDEESLHRRLSASEEMSIPSDLEAKLADFRARLPSLIEHWTRACHTLDRIVRRREQQALDMAKLGGELDAASLADQPDAHAGGYRPAESEFVERDIGQTSEHLNRAANALETRAVALCDQSLERLKAHRALYSDFGSLLGRQDRLAPDAVDRLNKRIESALARLETVRREKKEKWEEHAEKLTSTIEHDQRTVEALLRRRIFIRFAMWEELQFLFRSSRLIQVTLRGLSEGEHAFDDRMASVWRSLADTLGPLV